MSEMKSEFSHVAALVRHVESGVMKARVRDRRRLHTARSRKVKLAPSFLK